MRKLSVVVFLFFCVSSLGTAHAKPVDGYKNFKFGQSMATVKRKLDKKWTCETMPQEKMTMIYCTGFEFAGQSTTAIVFGFVGGSLLRVFVSGVQMEPITLLKALIKKFGQPSKPVDTDLLTAFDKGQINEVWITFASDTVGMKLERQGTQIQTNIMYSHPDFDAKIQGNMADKAVDDL